MGGGEEWYKKPGVGWQREIRGRKHVPAIVIIDLLIIMIIIMDTSCTVQMFLQNQNLVP